MFIRDGFLSTTCNSVALDLFAILKVALGTFKKKLLKLEKKYTEKLVLNNRIIHIDKLTFSAIIGCTVISDY